MLKNRVITISGEPASGKSTVINKLKEDYEKQGYKVNILTIGHEFRKMAQEKGMSIKEFNKYMETRKGIDEYIDSKVAEEGKKINENERPNEIFIFDSRLAFHNIPDSFSVRLTVDENIAGQRVFADMTRGKEDCYKNVNEAILNTVRRKESEIDRYKERYNIDIQDINNYNLVIDTSYSKVDDIASVIEQCLELEKQEQYYAKTWTSPKKLLPMQSEMSTLCKGTMYTMEEMQEIIKKEGYKPSEEIDIIDVDNKKFIIEGHHRNFALATVGGTLVPYYTLAKDNERIPDSNNTARQRAVISKRHLLGHEMFFDTKDKQFSYDEVYPNIYKELDREER